MSSPEAFAPRSLWRHRPFLHYFASRALSEFSYQIAAVAVGWQIYALTHSAFDLGLAGLVQFLPSALLMFPAGHAAVRCRPAPGNLPRSQDLPLAAYLRDFTEWALPGDVRAIRNLRRISPARGRATRADGGGMKTGSLSTPRTSWGHLRAARLQVRCPRWCWVESTPWR